MQARVSGLGLGIGQPSASVDVRPPSTVHGPQSAVPVIRPEMAVINYKINVCRITVASRLFAGNNYFPLFRVRTPADAARELAARSGGGPFRPKNHYMPVLLSASRRRSRSAERGRRGAGRRPRPAPPRPHARLDGHRYMSVRLEAARHQRLLALLQAKPGRLRGGYVYRVPARDTCLVFDGRLEEAARAGDIADVTIADHADKMILRLRGGDKLTADAGDYVELDEPAGPDEPARLYEGEAATTKEHEARHHHYGRSTMSIAHVFELKERSAAVRELERLQAEARRRQRGEREWKDGMGQLLANLRAGEPASGGGGEQLDGAELGPVADPRATLDVAAKLAAADLVHRLPAIKQVNRLVRPQHLGRAQLVELADTCGALVTMDDRQFFVVGQTVRTQGGEELFVPGQTFQSGALLHYMPGITVNVDDAPVFVAGAIFADDKGAPVFLPGQSLLDAGGRLTLPRPGQEPPTPDGMKRLQMSDEEQRQRAHRCRADRKALRRENRRRAADREKAAAEAEAREARPADEVQAAVEQAAAVEEAAAAEAAPVEPAVAAPPPGDQVLAAAAAARPACGSAEAERAAETAIAREPTHDGNGGIDGFSVAEENASMEQSETLRRYNQQIATGTFLQDHTQCLIAELATDAADRDRDVVRAKNLRAKLEEERKRNALVADDMKDVIDALELKKTKLLEKLKNIQNETATVEDRAVTYIYPAKANALAAELGFEGRMARDAAKILLGVARWASGYTARFHVHGENVPAAALALPTEGTEGQRAAAAASAEGSELREALRAAMAAAVRVFRERPRDLEAGMRAAGREFARRLAGSERPERALHDMSAAVQSRTDAERNELFSDTLKDLTRKVVVNKADTLRSIVREQYDREAIVAKVNLAIEDEGDILVRGFSNLAIDNEPLVRAVYEAVVAGGGGGAVSCEQEAAAAAHRAVVDAVQSVYERQLGAFLRSASAHDAGHLLLEARTLAQLVGMRNEARTLERLVAEAGGRERDCVSVRALALDQVTLALVRRALVMRRLAERNPYLAAGMTAVRRSGAAGRCLAPNDGNVRELVLESGALSSHACPILSSLDIPSFLFELGDSMAMEDFLVRRIKRSGALLICCGSVQAVVPKEASRFVLAGLVAYTLIHDKGVSHFRPMHVFSALKLDKRRERRYHEYSCVGAFDKYAYSVPIRDTLDSNLLERQLLPADHITGSLCNSRVCEVGGGGELPEAAGAMSGGRAAAASGGARA